MGFAFFMGGRMGKPWMKPLCSMDEASGQISVWIGMTCRF